MTDDTVGHNGFRAVGKIAGHPWPPTGIRSEQCPVDGDRELLTTAAAAAAEGRIVAFGIEPTHPVTSYGYIRPGEKLNGASVRAVAAFVEKPDAATAATYLADRYLWNSGNFLFHAATMLGEIERFEPSMAEAAKAAVSGLTRDLDFYKAAVEHRRSYRPWGYYQDVDVAARYRVKRIVVKPGSKLSLQKHFHRSEHWVVVKGTAEVTLGNDLRIVHENESIYIPIGSVHRLANPGKIPLELIEVQVGSYLGEDDIVRLDDVYGRG